MMRCASSASSACTEMRTMVRPSTESGKIECGPSEEITDITPWVSSRPRTMCASMSEWLRKMATKSVTSLHPAPSLLRELSECRIAGGRDHRQIVDLQQDHGHVVVLRRVAHEGGDLAQHPLAQLLRGQNGGG